MFGSNHIDGSIGTGSLLGSAPGNGERPSLRALLRGLGPSKPRTLPDTPVARIATDSRRVIPGSVFFAMPGLRTHGTYFIEEAIARGATAVVSPHAPGRAVTVPWLQAEDMTAALSRASARYYDAPDTALRLIGITGTNGKTTTAMVTQYLLKALGHASGLIGTIHYDLGSRTLPSFRTTPLSVDLFDMFAQMRDAQCRYAAMEVSSHALEQRRVEGIRIPVTAFLNLTRDHLDYHGTMEAYYLAKRRLFDNTCQTHCETAVINLGDPWGRRLYHELPPTVRPVGFLVEGEAGAAPATADPPQGNWPLTPAMASVRATDVELTADGARFSLATGTGAAVAVTTRLLGRYNVANVVASLALVEACGLDTAAAAAAVAGFPGVPGRMEPVDVGQPFRVVVDYAHTADALANALTMLRDITPGRLITLFGCGGDRDRSKRPLMVEAVQRLGDLSFATADNPRRECLEQIFRDMRKGVIDPSTIQFVDDRRLAISRALDAARPGDTVLIAGKGHETFQEFADTVQTFDDHQVAQELLRCKGFDVSNPQ